MRFPRWSKRPFSSGLWKAEKNPQRGYLPNKPFEFWIFGPFSQIPLENSLFITRRAELWRGEGKRRHPMETGIVVVEKVAGKSTVTRCFCKCPLKLIIPTKVCIITSIYPSTPSQFISWMNHHLTIPHAPQVGFPNTDAVWIYTLSYGGGLVSV